jgi:predicted nucleotidyltransferase
MVVPVGEVGALDPLIRVPHAAIAEAVRRALRSVRGVAGAYLFGSSLDECRPDSDIDIGVVPAPGADPFQLIGDVEAACRSVDGHTVHATVLDGRDVLFCFAVLDGGELLYCPDPNTVTDLIEHVARRYADVAFLHQRALREIYSG